MSPSQSGASLKEFSVVWRWRTDPYRAEFSEERRKLYKTEAGASRLIAKLNSHGGHFEKYTDVDPSPWNEGLIVEHWTLDYARLEAREVGVWGLLGAGSAAEGAEK